MPLLEGMILLCCSWNYDTYRDLFLPLESFVNLRLLEMLLN